MTYALNSSVASKQLLEIQLQFKTTNAMGLVAFVHNADASIFAAVYIENGALRFRLSCTDHHQMNLMEIKGNVSDGSTHTLLVR